MIYPIVSYGNTVLRKKAQELSEEYPELQHLIGDMFETMDEAGGVGLAAPQIDLSIRLFVVDANPFSEDDPKAVGFRKAFINPTIIEEDGEPWVFNEGCLSFPGLHEDVLRKPRIKIKYQDEAFVWHEEELDGYVARVVQHEYDHIEGKVFIDKLSTLRRALIKKKLDNISKGAVSVDYRMKWSMPNKKRK